MVRPSKPLSQEVSSFASIAFGYPNAVCLGRTQTPCCSNMSVSPKREPCIRKYFLGISSEQVRISLMQEKPKHPVPRISKTISLYVACIVSIHGVRRIREAVLKKRRYKFNSGALLLQNKNTNKEGCEREQLSRS